MQDNQYAEVQSAASQNIGRQPRCALTVPDTVRGEQDASEDARLQDANDAAAALRRAELRRQGNENLRHG
jgi:hypothetical protein